MILQVPSSSEPLIHLGSPENLCRGQPHRDLERKGPRPHWSRWCLPPPSLPRKPPQAPGPKRGCTEGLETRHQRDLSVTASHQESKASNLLLPHEPVPEGYCYQDVTGNICNVRLQQSDTVRHNTSNHPPKPFAHRPPKPFSTTTEGPTESLKRTFQT